MLDTECRINQFLVGYCQLLAGDIEDARMAEQPVPGVNHPAWILGHLAFTADAGASRLTGGAPRLADWAARFGPGSKLTSNRSHYPSREVLLSAIEQAFDRARQAAASATEEQLAKPSTNPRMKDLLPTTRESFAFLLTGHLGIHLGQLSSWRRIIGVPALF